MQSKPRYRWWWQNWCHPSTLHLSREFKCHIPPFDNVQIYHSHCKWHIECRWASCWNTLQASYLLPHLAYMQRRLVPKTDIRLTTATLHMDLHMNVGLPSSTTSACKPAHSIIEKWSGIMPSWLTRICLQALLQFKPECILLCHHLLQFEN